ncbi:unnamed protein product [Clonostachys rosea]|uniref:DNA helicase n=1 Tax=Bionectria ochroleuca TaxID=29856 RepID=A0ABY6U1C5_BIOOC|nr:unnamed protein product [Clonostachys rosea]
MTKPASTDGVLPDAPPSGPNKSNDETSLTQEGQDVINDHPLSHVTGNKLPNGRVEVGDVPMEPSTDAPTAPATNGHTMDGENVAINGHNSVDKTHDDDERPAKRRRTRDATPPPSARKFKPISPPWKRFEAEGPTSYTDNGRRRSGRTNSIPIEHQPSGKKRLTRATINGAQNTPPAKIPPPPSPRSSRSSHVASKSASIPKPSPLTKSSNTRSSSGLIPKPNSKKSDVESKASSRATRRHTPPPATQPTRQSRRSLRLSRQDDEFDDIENTTPLRSTRQSTRERPGPSPRIKLRVGRSDFIPLVHPDQVRKRPKIGTSFEDFWNRAGGVPVEEGGLQVLEDGTPYSDEAALKDAHLIMRIEDEAEPGGLLSEGRCSLFAPEGEEEPPRQWARQDHMVRAMCNFRRLMLAEQQRHRATAKKLAEACRDEWIRRQPKSAEEIEREAKDYWIGRYRLVVRTLFGTWDNVRVEVNRRRLEQWEAAEQRRVKAALNEAVNLSEQKLQARQTGLDSEMISDEDDMSDMTDDLGLTSDGEGGIEIGSESSDDEADDENSDNMSSSGDEDDDDDGGDVADEGLTQEQLQAKYANIPNVTDDAEQPADAAQAPIVNGVDDHSGLANDDDTTDESVDMDDDMGTTDSDESGSAKDDSEESDEDGSADEAGGLLGMLFGKSELKTFKSEAENELPTSDVVSKAQGQEAKNDAVPPSPHERDDEEKMTGLEEETDGHLPDPAVTVADLEDKNQPEGQAEVNGLHKHEPPQACSDPEGNAIDTALEAQKPSISSPMEVDHTSVSEPFGKSEDDSPCVINGTHVPEPDDAVMGDSENRAEVQQDNTQLAITQKHHGADLPIEKVSSNELEQLGADDKGGVGESEQVDPGNTETPETTVAATESSPPTSDHNIEVPFLLRGTLREYQHHGLDWLAGLYANNTNGILADEMGLGKTIQTIALLAHLACNHHVWGPHLVIVPTSVMLNWEMEFKKWCPGFKILAYYGTQDERKRKRQGWNNDDVWNVCITSYQLVIQDHQVFKRRKWHYLILDEAHNIKNFKSQRWQTLLGFNTEARLLLTGTPLQNNLTELWSLLFFLMPGENGIGGFADLQEFHDWFHRPESQILESGREQMDEEAKALISKLHKVLRPYLLRRLKADVEKQMPGKYEHVEFCRLSKRQRELYDGFLSRADTKDTLASGNYMSIINCLMQLRKVCNHPDLFIDRPIMTSFRMIKSVPAEYSFTEQTVKRCLFPEQLMSTVSLDFLNMIPTQNESLSTVATERIWQLSGSNRTLTELRESQKSRAQKAHATLDPSTVNSNIAYLESAGRWGRFDELQHVVYLNALRRQQKPIYGKNLIDLLTIGVDQRPCKPKPKVPKNIMAWFEEDSSLIRSMMPSVDQRADAFRTTIEKFCCVTPAVVTRDLDSIVLGHKGVNAFTDEDLRLSAPVHWTPWMPKEPPPDPWHEARMRSSIQFPDKRLLQYDCGKLQVLDGLLRKLQAGGHRALIFTQMTKVLDILERFLNIHGHKYLRLDGATKVEQRQILTDRFNHDPRILCFILSTRSGGLGINLTGADTVIFYDQDWNPAMDKQCQDRCHRIGQTRDVHIYRLVSEHTIEANILRKASQKQMLDDVVIQEGEFTTDTFNKVSVGDVLKDKVDFTSEGVSAADAALDRVLGTGPDDSSGRRTVGRALEQAEDKEDVTAARAAEKEILADDEDFTEKPSNTASGASTTRQGTPATKSILDGGALDEPNNVLDEVEYNAWGAQIKTIDQYMLSTMAEYLKDTKLELPKDKKKSKKKGKDTRKR